MSPTEKMVSNHAEEYLEAIYRLENKTGFARTMDLSRELGVVPGSITNTVTNLEKRGLVIHEPYKGVKLTTNGRKIASNIIRRHRLAERLLTDLLKLDWSDVHDSACKLEHALTSEILKPLEKALGYPKTCPHGNPIPTENGRTNEEKTKPLSDMNSGDEGIIVKITDEEKNILKGLKSLRILPNSRVKVENNDASNPPLDVMVNGNSLTIDPKLANHVQVKLLKIRETDKNEI